MSTPAPARDIPWDRLQSWSLVVGGLGLALWVIAWLYAAVVGDPLLLRKVFFSYLYAFMFSLAVPLGCLALWMIHNQTGGIWGQLIRRVLEASSRVLPLMALLFVPLAFGLPQLYLWADPTPVPEGHLLDLIHYRAGFYNMPFFLVRAAIYFAVWIVCMFLLNRWSAQLDTHPDPVVARRMQVFSGPGLVLWGLTVTFAAIDWLMSLEPDWFSTIYGMLIAGAQAVPSLGFAIALSVWLYSYVPLTAEDNRADNWNDLGNLLLAVVMVWAYLSFSQLLLVWAGNLPEEVVWYLRRSQGGWEWIAIFLAIFYFGLPFAVLLSPANKRDPQRLMRLAVVLIVISAIHHYWLVNPVYAQRLHPEATHGFLINHPLEPLIDLAALLGLGGLTFAAIVWQLKSRPLLPPVNPLMQEVLHHV